MMWISISGCESFLDVTPKGLDVLKTTDQFNGIFNNANLFSYLNVRNQPGGISSLLGSAEMAENTDMSVYSPDSPMGLAIMGAKIGESVSYTAPNGKTLTVKIVSVKHFEG